jgi:hypothetical protein
MAPGGTKEREKMLEWSPPAKSRSRSRTRLLSRYRSPDGSMRHKDGAVWGQMGHDLPKILPTTVRG